MIYAVDARNRHHYEQQIEQMFRMRHRIYVERRKWVDLARPDKREVDQFDNEDATYLLGIDDTGEVYAGLRLVPTTGPHLIRDVFPHAVQWGPIPQAKHILEFTRYFVGRRQPGITSRQTAGNLLCAMFEYGLARSISHFSLLCDSFFLPHMLECGWSVRPLGRPLPYPEGECIAVLFEVSLQAIEGTRKARNLGIGPYLANRDFVCRTDKDAHAA
jgi:acyl-homoserine lactone synthase